MMRRIILVLAIGTFLFSALAGTSWAIEKQTCLKVANFWLKEIRSDPTKYGDAIWNIRDMQKECGLSLAEIGTTEEELAKLKMAGCTKRAKKLIRALGKRLPEHEENLAFILLMEELEECNLTIDRLFERSQEAFAFSERVRKRRLIERNTDDRETQMLWKKLLIFQPRN